VAKSSEVTTFNTAARHASTPSPVNSIDSIAVNSAGTLLPPQVVVTATGGGVAVTTEGVGKKWLCMACTFHNWPKALKCVMCHVPRQTVITTATTATSGSHKQTKQSSATTQLTGSNSNNRFVYVLSIFFLRFAHSRWLILLENVAK
jgi:hypothetical protein